MNTCKHCGYAFQPFDAECPRCHGYGVAKTPIRPQTPVVPAALPGAPAPPSPTKLLRSAISKVLEWSFGFCLVTAGVLLITLPINIFISGAIFGTWFSMLYPVFAMVGLLAFVYAIIVVNAIFDTKATSAQACLHIEQAEDALKIGALILIGSIFLTPLGLGAAVAGIAVGVTVLLGALTAYLFWIAVAKLRAAREDRAEKTVVGQAPHSASA